MSLLAIWPLSQPAEDNVLEMALSIQVRSPIQTLLLRTQRLCSSSGRVDKFVGLYRRPVIKNLREMEDTKLDLQSDQQFINLPL